MSTPHEAASHRETAEPPHATERRKERLEAARIKLGLNTADEVSARAIDLFLDIVDRHHCRHVPFLTAQYAGREVTLLVG